MKYRWYFCDAVKDSCDTLEDAVDELNKHLDFDITDINQYLAHPSPDGGTIYYYPDGTPDSVIDNDDGAYTPQIKAEV